MDDHPGRRACRPVLVAVVAVLAMLATASAAGAHARLITTDPANDAVLEQSPDAVVLRFDEPVETAFGAIRVYDARARRVDSGDVERPSGREAQIALDRRLARGTYTATWRALSGDGHPVSGAFVFHVGAPGANPAGVAAQVLDDGTPASVSVLVLDRPGARLPPPAPGRRRHVDARGRARPRVGGDAVAADVGAGRAIGPARVRRARGDRAPGSGRGWLRPRRGAPLGRRRGGARDAVRDGLARAGRARSRVCRRCCSGAGVCRS